MASVLPADKRILQIAAEVAETTDENVPIILLGLKEVLHDHPLGSSKAAAVRLDLWNYDLIQVINLVLKQSITLISGQVTTASELCVILCTCCCGLKVPDSLEFQRQFLPSILETVLYVLCQLSEKLTGTSSTKEKGKILNCSMEVLMSLSDLLQYCKFLSVPALASKRFLQLLMTEENDISLVVMNLVIAIVKSDRNAFADLPEAKLNSIIDELVFKLSAASDAMVASTATRVLLFCLDTYPPLIDLLTSKRYKGLKAYLGKWKGKGFARDILRLTAVLEARSIQQVEFMKRNASAAKIQAAYKGYKTRQKLAKASKAIGTFHQLYRSKKTRQRELQEQQEFLKTQQELENARKRREFMTSRSKQLKIMETMPARTVNTFLEDLQNRSAIKIQSTWRGHRTRGTNKPVIDGLRKLKAVVRIQKEVRRWLKRRNKQRQRIVKDLYPAGLDDNRRVQLQNLITNVREQFPSQSRDLEDVKKLHSEAYGILSSYYSQLPSMRRQDQHRRALLAQITILSEQLETAPNLKDATDLDIDRFSSSSAPVVVAAKKRHQETLNAMHRQWWEKLVDDDEDKTYGGGGWEFDGLAEQDKQF